MKIKEGLAHFLLQLDQLNYSPHTLKQYRIDGEQFLFAAKEQDIEKIMDPAFLSFCDQYEQVLLEQGFKPTSIRRKVSSLQSFLTFLQTAHFLPQTPPIQLTHSQAYATEMKLPTREEVAAIQAYYQQSHAPTTPAEWVRLRNACLLTFVTTMGLKVQQLANIQYGHLQLDEQVLAVPKGALEFVEIPIPKQALSILRRYLQETTSYFEEEWQASDALFFSNRHLHRQQLTVRTMERAIQKATNAVNPTIKGSELRYFVLVELANRFSIEQVAEQLNYQEKEQMLTILHKISISNDNK